MKPSQDKVLEYKILFQQLQKLQQQIGAVEQHLGELSKIQESVEEISKIKKDSETFIPLGSGLFLKGKIIDNEKILMNVGAGICMEKSVKEAVETVQKQTKEIENLLSQLENDSETIAAKLESIKQEV